MIVQKRLNIDQPGKNIERSVCDSNSLSARFFNINLPKIKLDSAKWRLPENRNLPIISNPNSINPDSVVFTELTPEINKIEYVIYSEGCQATYNLLINNNMKSPKAIALDSVLRKCSVDSIFLRARTPILEGADYSLFKYNWSTSPRTVITDTSSTLMLKKDRLAKNEPSKFYFIVKNGVCPANIDSVQVTNYERIDSINSGMDQTVCATKYKLNGFKSPSYASGEWINITNPLKRDTALNFSTVRTTSNVENRFIWKVVNGECKKSDTLNVLVGDSISSAKVDNPAIIDCDTGDVFLKANNPSLNGGKGFWWKKSENILSLVDTLSFKYEFKYPIKSNSSRDTLLFFYTIKNDYCSSTASDTVYYFKKPSIANAGEDQTLVKKQTVMNANNPEVGLGTWYLKSGVGSIAELNNPNTTINDLVFGKNVFVWSIANGPSCRVSEDEVVISFSDFDIPQAFSPNNDGKNDKFEIVGLENYAGSKLKVLNRWGREVFSSDDYKNDWSAIDLDDDTYFYLLEIPGIEVKHGYVIVKRK